MCDSWLEECRRILDRFYSTSSIFSASGRDFVSFDSIEHREIIQLTDGVLFNSDFSREWTCWFEKTSKTFYVEDFWCLSDHCSPVLSI